MSVTELDNYRPHTIRTVDCFKCHHTWEAVYPTYASDGIKLECPSCGHIGHQIMAKECEVVTGKFVREQLCSD